jgi:hypothetical protein
MGLASIALDYRKCENSLKTRNLVLLRTSSFLHGVASALSGFTCLLNSIASGFACFLHPIHGLVLHSRTSAFRCVASALRCIACFVHGIACFAAHSISAVLHCVASFTRCVASFTRRRACLISSSTCFLLHSFDRLSGFSFRSFLFVGTGSQASGQNQASCGQTQCFPVLHGSTFSG